MPNANKDGQEDDLLLFLTGPEIAQQHHILYQVMAACLDTFSTTATEAMKKEYNGSHCPPELAMQKCGMLIKTATELQRFLGTSRCSWLDGGGCVHEILYRVKVVPKWTRRNISIHTDRILECFTVVVIHIFAE